MEMDDRVIYMTLVEFVSQVTGCLNVVKTLVMVRCSKVPNFSGAHAELSSGCTTLMLNSIWFGQNRLNGLLSLVLVTADVM